MEQENSLIPEEQINTPEISENNVTEETTKPQEEAAVETQKEKKEIPDIDFSTLSTDEIIRQAQKLVNDYPLASIKDAMEKLPETFEAQYKNEYDKALAAFTADGDLPENFEYKNDSKERFNAVYKLYKDKRSSMNRQTEAEREENLQIKLGIIEELKEIGRAHV